MRASWDPFAEITRDFFGRPANGDGDGRFVPRVDIFETQDAIEIEADVAGVKPEDVKLSVDKNVLTIHGQRSATPREEGGKVRRTERAVGQFQRAFTLGERIDASRITATQKDGVLTVTLPKVEARKPREISVAAA